MPVSEQTQELELKQEGLTILQRATLVKILDQGSYDSACDLLQKTIIPFRKRWLEYWEKPKKLAWDAYKSIQAKYQELDEPAEMAERAVKTEIAKWNTEQERIEQERQREAQREAERRAQEDQLAAAIFAEQAGASKEEVQAIIDTPALAVAAPVSPSYQRAQGISQREHWVAVVTDFHSLVRAAAKDKSLLPYLQVNQSALNKRAGADKTTLNIPGVVARNDAIVAARGR